MKEFSEGIVRDTFFIIRYRLTIFDFLERERESLPEIHAYIHTYMCVCTYMYIYYIKYYRYFDVFIDIFCTKLSIISADCKLYDDYIDNDIMNEINIKLTIH